VDRLWDAYELSRSAAQKLRLDLESVPKATRRIAELRRELASLGSPNIGAIEEFERVNERHAFLTSQRDDIERAKKEPPKSGKRHYGRDEEAVCLRVQGYLGPFFGNL
jgi:chromosome segregation protein